MKTYKELTDKISLALESLAVIVTANLLSRLTSMRASGMDNSNIKKILVADLLTSGRIFGQLKRGVKRISKNGIEEAGNIASYKMFISKGYKEYKWVPGGKNICPDCKTRHGDVGDISYFSTIGLPKSGFSVCEDNCNCQLVPVEYEGENLDKPIKYKKATEGRK